VGQDNIVGTASHFGLDSAGIKILVRVRFSPTIQIGPGAHPTSDTMGTGSLPGVKQLEIGDDHPTPLTAEDKERVQLYIYPSLSLRGLF
jgi:hypothetical protein